MSKFNPLDQVAFIKVELMADGGLNISGNIGDVQQALDMMENAMDHMRRNLKKKLEDQKHIIVPNRDVVIRHDPAYPLKALGDMKPGGRGDQ